MAIPVDPQFYVGLLAALVPAFSALGALYIRQKQRRSHYEQVEQLMALLPDDDVDPAVASLKQRYRWAEALRRFDMITLPRPQRGRAFVFSTIGWGSALIGSAYFVGALVPGVLTASSRVLAVLFALGMLIWAWLALLTAHDFRQPVYRLAGLPLPAYSPHATQIRRIRADYGLFTSLDDAAEEATRKRIERGRRARRWYTRRRYEFRSVALVLRKACRSTRVPRESAGFRQRGTIGTLGQTNLHRVKSGRCDA
ncbi:hypothetical protein R4144_08650 [Gordonia amicalis]|uniref:hypothetical protein n=1 Tax=Gordonia amicalis TaxID=89053 RepID=UPI0022A6886A|nr:hypothetical protein [Gordonia amicalis]MCZ0911873.1 hypothetical protein [Gordonia amicalis]MDV7173458.1 hypothetical protein [Gordonia amicalis]